MATQFYNASPGRYLSRKDFVSQDALFKATLGRPLINYLFDIQKQLMVWETHVTEPEMPEVADYYTEGKVYRDFKGDKSAIVGASVQFAGRFRFIAPEARFGDIDFLKEIFLIAQNLKIQCAIPERTGNYARSFYYLIGGTAYENLPVGKDFTVIGITNIATYASTMENPTWHQPFNRCWRGYVVHRAKALGYDAVFKYINGGSVPYFHKGIRPDPHSPKTTYPRWIRYAIPTIQIGPYGSLKVTGKPRARHRKNRRRMI